MSVTRFVKHWSGSTGEAALGSYKYTAVYKVVTNSALDNAKVIIDYILGAGGHSLGESYTYGNDTDATSFLKSIAPSRLPTSAFHWDVVLSYEPANTKDSDEDNQEPKNDGSGDPTNDPSLWYDRISEDGMTITTPVEVAKYIEGFVGQANRMRKPDSTGPVHNSAFQVFSPGLERETEAKVIRRTWYSNTYQTLNALNGYLGFVNSADYVIDRSDVNYTQTLRKYTAKFKKSSTSLDWVNKGLWWHHSIEIWWNPFGWRRQVVDRGRYARAMAGDPDGHGGIISDSDLREGAASVRALVDTNGDPIEDDVLLNGDGQPLAVGAKPVYLTYQITPEDTFPPELMGMM